MRPPHYAGENSQSYQSTNPNAGSFNEAPALRGGELPAGRGRGGRARRFNEAPALRGGEHEDDGNALDALAELQ